nr:MAG TPA: hypothetical protein [Caudoviricetes sp.]
MSFSQFPDLHEHIRRRSVQARQTTNGARGKRDSHYAK